MSRRRRHTPFDDYRDELLGRSSTQSSGQRRTTSTSTTTNEATRPLVISERAVDEPFDIPTTTSFNAHRRRTAEGDRNGIIRMSDEYVSPNDVESSARAMVSVAHEFHDWDNDRRRNQYEHEERQQKQQGIYDLEMKKYDAWSNPTFGQNILASKKADYEYNLQLNKLKLERQRQIHERNMEAIAEMRRKNDAKYTRTDSSFNQLLDNLGLSPYDLDGSGCVHGYCKSRAFLYGNYIESYFIWGAHSVDIDAKKNRICIIDVADNIKYIDYSRKHLTTLPHLVKLGSLMYVVDIVAVSEDEKDACKI